MAEIQYVYSQLIDVSKLPTKTVTWDGPHSLQEVASFLHLYDIFCADYLDWTVHHYYYSDSNKHSIVFVTSQSSSLQFLLLRKGYYNAGIKAIINGVGANYSQDKAINTVAKNNDDGTTTYQISIDLTDFQGFLDIRYSYMQNGDYTYSELFEQGDHNIEESESSTDVWILNSNKNGYPKVEIPLYGINGKCIRGYSNIFAHDNYGITLPDVNADVFYGNTLLSNLKDTVIEDSSKLYKPEQFRSSSFGLVQSTKKLKTIFKWSDYKAEQRIRITAEYDYNNKQIIIKRYSIPLQSFEITYNDFKDNLQTYQNKQGSYTTTYHFHNIVKDQLDLSWNAKDWSSKCNFEEQIVIKSKEPFIAFDLYKGTEYKNLTTGRNEVRPFDNKITGAGWIYNDRDFRTMEYISGTSTDNKEHHIYDIYRKSVLNPDDYLINPTTYGLELKKGVVYEFLMTNFDTKTISSPNIYFASDFDFKNLHITKPRLFKTKSLTYTTYDGVPTIPEESYIINTIPEAITKYNYYVSTNILYDDYKEYSGNEGNDTYIININIISANYNVTPNTLSTEQFYSSYDNVFVTTNTDMAGKDSCRMFIPSFDNSMINNVQQKSIVAQQDYINGTPYYFLNDYVKNYFLISLWERTYANYTYDCYQYCPAFDADSVLWSKKEIIPYWLDYTIEDKSDLSYVEISTNTNYEQKDSWLSALIYDKFRQQLWTKTDFNKYSKYSAVIVDNENWPLGNQQTKYVFLPPYPQYTQSLNGGIIYGLISSSNPSKSGTVLPIYPDSNVPIAGLVIYAKEED